MVEPVARIRLFQPSDDKHVRFLIGKANMESLATANRLAYTHPLTLSLWIALSCIFIQYMHWWPNPSLYGPLGYLTPVPAFAATAAPIIALIDWINRPFFEKQMREVLLRADIPDISMYYARSPSSGFWILEYGERFVGLIGLDASRDSTSNAVIVESAATEKRPKRSLSTSKGTSTTATIRHFYVDEEYRSSEIQNDLLAHAVNYAFRASPTLQSIQAIDSPLTLYARKSLQNAGFKLDHHTEKVGIFGWKLGMRVLERDTWGKSVEE